MGDGEETAGSRVENDMRPTRPTRPTIVLLLTALSTLACRSERSPAAPPTVEITYWLVAGRRTQKYAAGPGLKDVEKVLAAVADADGPMEFTLVERPRLTSLSSERGFAQGQMAEVNQRATVTNGTLVADLRGSAKP